jgi:hypothetical protein
MAATKGINWAKHRKRLGTLPDAEFARELGVSNVQVHYKRSELGIPAFFDNFWTRRRIEVLGTNYDQYWADKWKVSVSRVIYKRLQLGITSFRASGKNARHSKMRS